MPEMDPLQEIYSRLGVETQAQAVYEIWRMQNQLRVLEEKTRNYPVVGRAA